MGQGLHFPQKPLHPWTYLKASSDVLIWKLYFNISSKEISKELSHSLSTYSNGNSYKNVVIKQREKQDLEKRQKREEKEKNPQKAWEYFGFVFPFLGKRMSWKPANC